MKINSKGAFEPQIGEEINVEINGVITPVICVEQSRKKSCKGCKISINRLNGGCSGIYCSSNDERDDKKDVIFIER